MTEEEVKEWLNRAFYANKKAKALEEFVERCKTSAEGVSGCCKRNDMGKSTGSKNGTEKAFISLADVESKAKKQKDKTVGIVSEVQDAIALLCDDDLEAVLINRYLNFHTIEETAEIMSYSPRTVRDKQKKAVKKLCLLLPCFASLDVL